jgi:hypothetical protein
MRGGPGRIRTSNQTVMSGWTRIAGVDFPEDLTRSIVFVASHCRRFWCETGAVITPARILRLRDRDADGYPNQPVGQLAGRRAMPGLKADGNDGSTGPLRRVSAVERNR